MTAAEILALTLCAEAGHRPVRAIEALAALVVNRARLAAGDAAARARFAPAGGGAGWAGLVPAVCRAPFLFGCWNPRHPHRAALLAALRAAGPATDGRPADPMLAACRRIAARALGGGLPDLTAGATHWHDGAVVPGWAIGQIPTTEAGGLVFYRPPEQLAAGGGRTTLAPALPPRRHPDTRNRANHLAVVILAATMPGTTSASWS